MPNFCRLGVTLLTAVCIGLPLADSLAGSHTWDVNEVFTDATGNVQFIELREVNGTPNENGVPGHDMTSDAKSFVISGAALASPTTNKFYLMGTAAFAALPGAPTPDAIIPAGVLPFFFSPGGDTVTYVPWDSVTFASAPTDGLNSLAGDGVTTQLNSPTNYAGQSSSVDASASIPTLSEWGLILFALLLAAAGVRVALSLRLGAAVHADSGGTQLARVPSAARGWQGYLPRLAVAQLVALTSLLVLYQLGWLEAWLDVGGTLLAAAIVAYIAHLVLREQS